MLPHSDQADSAMTSGYVMRVRVESWLADDQLDGDIPVAGGNVTEDVTLNVPESLSMTVPTTYEGTSYVPGSAADHPLACWGQRLRVSLGADISGGTEWFGRSWLYITDTSVDQDTVTVTASGLLGLLDEAQLVSPVTATGTFKSMIAQLTEPALTVDFSGAPDDIEIPSGTTWDAGTSRLDALNELLDSWAATAYADEAGILVIVPAGDTDVRSLTLTDGTGGTTMRWGTDITREGAANIVVAQGTTPAGDQVQAVAYDNNPNSPTFHGGHFSALDVPYFFYSPLLTTRSQCQAAANTILGRRRAQAARKITTTAVPYLALQARDGLSVTAENLGVGPTFGVADQLDMPLTPDGGAMTLGVRLP